ncbi:unnamed protein product [Anisakis simplex]|uniref:Uncharacterized protein n=1 Tax=Anisakis simplex TaxID=6269 RepID=A0A0M3IZ48_ANISI|nr:unnamed protein product [Anisakis simplex]
MHTSRNQQSTVFLSPRYNMRRNTVAYQQKGQTTCQFQMPVRRFSPIPMSAEEERKFLMTRLHTLQAKVLTSNLRLPPQFKAKLDLWLMRCVSRTRAKRLILNEYFGSLRPDVLGDFFFSAGIVA